MKPLIIFTLLALTTIHRAEGSTKKKRGIYGESGLSIGHNNLVLGGLVNLGQSIDPGHGHGDFNHDNTEDFINGYSYGYGGGHHNVILNHESGLNFGNTYGAAYGYHGQIDLGSHVQKHITITKKIGVPVPNPYPVHVEKTVPVPVPHPVPVPIDNPYPVHIPKPYPVHIEKPVPYPVVKDVPYPVPVPYKVAINIPVPIAIPKLIPVQKTIEVSAPANTDVQTYTRPAISVGSGSIGYVKLPNGNYVLGSGSLGYSSTGGKMALPSNSVNIPNQVTKQNVVLNNGYGTTYKSGYETVPIGRQINFW